MNQDTLYFLLTLPILGWVTKEVVELRSIKHDVPYIRERLDDLYDKLVAKGIDKPQRDEVD
jgi:hypothetical protein